MKGLTFAFALGLTAGAVAPVHAMGQCGDREAIATHLTAKFGERNAALGLASSPGLREIWASDATGSWSILLTRPDGQTCIMATGTHFQALPEVFMPTGYPV